MRRAQGRSASIASGQYRDLGVLRVMTLLRESAKHDGALASLADDARAAGVDLA